MSDTPRTDALADKMPTRTMDEGILLDHARQLERENAALLLKLESARVWERVLLQKNAALRADAERYRWLRDSANETDEGTKVIQFICDFDNYNDLDAAIDAARGKA